MTDSINPTGNVVGGQFVLDPTLEQFLDRLVKEKTGEVEVTPDYLESLKSNLRPLLLKKLNLALFEALSPNDRQQFSHLVDNNTPDAELQEFFTTHLPNSQQIVAETLLDFRNLYLE